MSTGATLERAGFRVRDEIELPRLDGAVVQGHATRTESYPILVTGSLEETVARLRDIADEAQLAVISEDVVYDLHGEGLVAALREAGFTTEVHVLPPGERSKSLDRALELWDWLAHSSISRRDLVVSLASIRR